MTITTVLSIYAIARSLRLNYLPSSVPSVAVDSSCILPCSNCSRNDRLRERPERTPLRLLLESSRECKEDSLLLFV
jgi:hypothetical protein